MPSRFFVTGTDTNVGKTVASALLCAALDAIYWKPIQTGSRGGTDRATVMKIAGIPQERTIPEAYRFAPPISPHLAARLAGKRIEVRKIRMPRIDGGMSLTVEGAGGVLVPVNERQLMTAVMQKLGLPVLLVSRSSLGTINHTLLSLAALRAARLKVRGVIMVGEANAENRKAIEQYGKVEVIGHIPPLKKLERSALLKTFRNNFNKRALTG